MVIEPTDRDLQELNALLNQHPDAWEQNRDTLTRIWEGAVHDAMHRSFHECLSKRVHALMAPPPSLKCRCYP